MRRLGSDNFLHALTSCGTVTWLGALSFEERCVGSLRELANLGVRCADVVLLNYDTLVIPPSEDTRLRGRWLREIQQLVDPAMIARVTMDAHQFQPLVELMRDLLGRGDTLLVDISCFTKIHTIAAATVTRRAGGNVLVGYSRPENYGFVAAESDAVQWRDIVIAPLADESIPFTESASRGIIMPGHENDRLTVALTEIEPAGGIILFSETPARPDLRFISVSKNARITNSLRRMKSADWRKATVSIRRPDEIVRHVRREIASATSHNAPAILFPFGAKPVVFATATVLAQEYLDGAWFVCPIPNSYEVGYSFGVAETIWFAL